MPTVRYAGPFDDIPALRALIYEYSSLIQQLGPGQRLQSARLGQATKDKLIIRGVPSGRIPELTRKVNELRKAA